MNPNLPQKQFKSLAGWGRFPVGQAAAVRPERLRDLGPVGEHCLARGMGRSYGDTALLTGGVLVLTERLNKLHSFDPATGELVAEAGVTLSEVLETFVPKGWFVPVTPGTQFCSLGGCVAADVHGKNHHRDGAFGAHVTRLELVLADGSTVVCSTEQTPDLFYATLGGVGLTGIVKTVGLKLVPIETAYMRVRHVRTRNLDQTVEYLTDDTHDAHYSVAWIDCLATGERMGRGILMTGEHATRSELPLKVEEPLRLPTKRSKTFPFEAPSWALNPVSIQLFNALYDLFQGGRGEFLSRYDSFFYPLDGVLGWNKMYGKRGFVQYQYVLPTETAVEGTRRILKRLSEARHASFLAVLKRFGAQGPGLLSFPMPGLTLALDIPLTPGLPGFLDELDKEVVDHGGRIYLAKDSRMNGETFRAGYPQLPEFCEARAKYDPTKRWRSDLADRLEICR